jgi:ABC-type multidrug transport system ATPase subunit
VADKLVEQLELYHCRNTPIGDSFKRGISGGEKKRVSIGVELISRPNLLFLDEPTTGLDSSNALGIMKLLKSLEETVICTIHSPNTEVLNLFDKVLILSDGNLVYDGKPGGIERRLNVLDF